MKLPIGIQTFEEIRSEGYTYVDKANFLIQMIDSGKIYFLSRPIILSFLRGCGVVVEAEMHTHLGRPDLVISHNNHVWVIEIKVAYEKQNTEKKAQEAYRQIIEKQYAKPYPNAVSIGLGIDDSLRQITAFYLENN